jgi:hypothetical protein
LAGLATNPALRLGSGRHHLANLHGKRDGDYHRRQRLTVRRPTKSPGEKLERLETGKSRIVIGYFGYFPSGPQGCIRRPNLMRTFTPCFAPVGRWCIRIPFERSLNTLHCGSTFRTNSANRGSERRGSSKKSVFKSSNPADLDRAPD